MDSSMNKSRSKTPPPAYTPTLVPSTPSGSGSRIPAGAGQLPSSSLMDPYNSVNYNPWASVPTQSHPNPPLDAHPAFGPTPTSALHIPYAYYDPRSEHSIAAADARAQRRFWEALFWVVTIWIAVGFVVEWVNNPSWHEGWPAWSGWH